MDLHKLQLTIFLLRRRQCALFSVASAFAASRPMWSGWSRLCRIVLDHKHTQSLECHFE